MLRQWAIMNHAKSHGRIVVIQCPEVVWLFFPRLTVHLDGFGPHAMITEVLSNYHSGLLGISKTVNLKPLMQDIFLSGVQC